MNDLTAARNQGFLVIKNDKVVKVCATVDEAKAAIEALKERDKLLLLTKKAVLKRMLKSDTDIFTDLYYVAEVHPL